MSRGEATTLWAQALVDELARAGVQEVALAPGSRSTPLVLAFAADDRFRLRVHLDERSAAFFALGVGKAGAGPAAVLTTSGTAAANLLPAVVEASRSQTPLLVLTADRPHRLRDADANQAIDQLRLFGRYPKAFFDVAPPAREASALVHLRSLVGRAVSATRGCPAGPVHLNIPLDKPLEPVPLSDAGRSFQAEQPLAAIGRPEGAPFIAVTEGRRAASEETLDLLEALLRGSRRGVVVAGPSPEPGRDGPAARRLAEVIGMPLLADPLSGARFTDEPESSVFGYDLFLRDPEVRKHFTPDLILRVGASPTSAALQGWFEAHRGVRHVVVDGGGRWKDHAAVATDYIVADAADTLRHVAGRDIVEEDSGWLQAWQAASRATLNTWRDESAGEAHEGMIVDSVVAGLPAGSTLFVSSSMPVRDLDAFAVPRGVALRVLGNRGASGIDGIVSSAFGVAAATTGPTVCVLGDLAFFHDQNGLLWARESEADVVFILVDNDGGGIFHMLPVHEHEPHFTPYFATPHGLDLGHSAGLHGIPMIDVDIRGVGAALQASLDADGTRIVRVKTDRDVGHRRRLAVAKAVARSVRAELG